MPVVDLGMDISPQYSKFKIDLEEAQVVSVGFKTGEVMVTIAHQGEQFTKTFTNPHPNFSRISERLTNHVFNVMRFDEEARQDVEWRGVKWQNRDNDASCVTLSFTYKSEWGMTIGASTPRILLEPKEVGYKRIGDLQESLKELEIEAKEAWGGKSAQMSLDFSSDQMRRVIERTADPKESESDGFEGLPDLNVNINGGAIPPADDDDQSGIITDEADESFGEAQEQSPGKSKAAPKKKPASKAKAEKPAKGTMAVVKDEAAA